MNKCFFCQIAKGEIPSRKVYEDENFLAFLDIRPLTRGNTLVIPKQHYRWADEVPNFGEYFEAAKKVGKAAKERLGAEWVSYITLGMEVEHAHIRVIPRYKNDGHPVLVKIDKFMKLTGEELDEIAGKMRGEAI
jgi:histidine triad (HIT) family protein